MNATRIVDIAQDLKAVDQVLKLRPFVLGLDLAALASRREYSNLEYRLACQFRAHRSQLVRTALECVGRQGPARAETAGSRQPSRADDTRFECGDDRRLYAGFARSVSLALFRESFLSLPRSTDADFN